MIIDTGKMLRIVTNDLDAPAEEIADLYKQRWQIELFFRWVKQTLRIKRFIGVSERSYIARSNSLALSAKISCSGARSTGFSSHCNRSQQIEIS